MGKDKRMDGKAFRSTPVRVEARDAIEAARWIKGGLTIEGKVREVKVWIKLTTIMKSPATSQGTIQLA